MQLSVFGPESFDLAIYFGFDVYPRLAEKGIICLLSIDGRGYYSRTCASPLRDSPIKPFFYAKCPLK